MDLRQDLQNIGLNPKEISILSYLYSKGKTTAGSISKEIQIPKSSVLFILYKLEEKGIVKKFKQGKVYIFNPTDPLSIINLLDSQIKTFTDKKKQILPLIPKIRHLKDLKADNKLYYYDKQSSINELRKSLFEQYDNKDTKIIYDKNNVKIFKNDDYVFLLGDEIAVRFDDIKTLIKFNLVFKYINAYEIES